MRCLCKASGKLDVIPALILAIVTAGVVLSTPSVVSAQAVTGTLLGNVVDSSGAAVPGATVTATEVQTNISRNTVSNETGYYIFASLKDGTYNIEAELQGFRKVLRQGVRLDVNTTMRVDLTMEIGQVTEAVTVSAESPVLQTDRADTGRLIESKMVTEIPLSFNRNFQGLLVTVPGATRPFRPHSQFFNSQDSLSTEINGQPRMANNTLIEGLDNNHKTGLLSVIIPAADALETVSVSTSNYDAEFGRSGGAITNVTLKSGTNTLRGSAFFFGNNESTNASDYFTHLKAPTTFAQGGFTLGGPIMRNKFFFFGDYQRTIDDLGYVVRAVVPTTAMRNGDFSAVSSRIYDPTTGNADGSGRVAFSNNQIPSGRISNIARESDAVHPRAEHRRRAAGPEQLPEGSDAREDDRCFRYEAQLHDKREQPAVGSLQFPASGRIRSGAVRRPRWPGQRRIRWHRHEQELQHRGELDARLQRHDGHGRARRRELLPQHRALARARVWIPARRWASPAPTSTSSRAGCRVSRSAATALAPLTRRLGLLPKPALGSIRGNVEYRDDRHQASAEPHAEAGRRVAAQPRHAPADAGFRRLARPLRVRRLGHGTFGRVRDPHGRRQLVRVVPARLAQRRAARPEGHRPARHQALGDVPVLPGQVAGAAEHHRGPRAAVGILQPARRPRGPGQPVQLRSRHEYAAGLRLRQHQRVGRRQEHVHELQPADWRVVAAQQRNGDPRRIRGEHDSVSGQPVRVQLSGQAELLGHRREQLRASGLDGHWLPRAGAGDHPGRTASSPSRRPDRCSTRRST